MGKTSAQEQLKDQAPESPLERKTSRRALTELYYRLRQREQTPRRIALSVGLGVWVGCLPVYGLHLILCLGFAKLLRLSGPIAYLAAHINNPWTAPFLLFLETTLGHRVISGRWLSPDPRALGDVTRLALGRDLVVGSLLLGVVLGAALSITSYIVSSRYRRSTFWNLFLNRAGRHFEPLGLRIWETARGKLRHDPVYLGLLRNHSRPSMSPMPLLPSEGRLVDLGCGRGLLFVAIRSAQSLAAEGLWPTDWQSPPGELELIGLELDSDAVSEARIALGDQASIVSGDLRTAEIPKCDAAALIDVLHYLERSDQEALLERVSGRLRAGGSLLIREADADGGLRFLATRVQERLSSWARFERSRRFAYRSVSEWEELLRALGLETDSQPMSEGTPFSNTLIRAVKPPSDGDTPPRS